MCFNGMEKLIGICSNFITNMGFLLVIGEIEVPFSSHLVVAFCVLPVMEQQTSYKPAIEVTSNVLPLHIIISSFHFTQNTADIVSLIVDLASVFMP